MRFDSLTSSPCVCPYQEKKDWPELQMLCSMMLGMTARWMLGRMLPEWPAVLSCVRFRPRLGCHLDVGDSRRGCLPPLRCSHKGNLSRRALSQSVTTASVRSLKCFGRCWEPHHRHTFEVGVRG